MSKRPNEKNERLKRRFLEFRRDIYFATNASSLIQAPTDTMSLQNEI